MTLNYNCYWNAFSGTKAEFLGMSFTEWQTTMGKDENSVLSDPLFVDSGNHDYTLQDDSPALELGFVNIDTSEIGPR